MRDLTLRGDLLFLSEGVGPLVAALSLVELVPRLRARMLILPLQRDERPHAVWLDGRGKQALATIDAPLTIETKPVHSLTVRTPWIEARTRLRDHDIVDEGALRAFLSDALLHRGVRVERAVSSARCEHDSPRPSVHCSHGALSAAAIVSDGRALGRGHRLAIDAHFRSTEESSRGSVDLSRLASEGLRWRAAGVEATLRRSDAAQRPHASAAGKAWLTVGESAWGPHTPGGVDEAIVRGVAAGRFLAEHLGSESLRRWPRSLPARKPMLRWLSEAMAPLLPLAERRNSSEFSDHLSFPRNLSDRS